MISIVLSRSPNKLNTCKDNLKFGSENLQTLGEQAVSCRHLFSEFVPQNGTYTCDSSSRRWQTIGQAQAEEKKETLLTAPMLNR